MVIPTIENGIHAILLENGFIVTESLEDINRPGVGISKFSLIHNFGQNGLMQLSYTEPNRNEGVINIQQSVNTTFSLKTRLILNEEDKKIVSPTLLFDPLVVANLGIDFSQTLAAIDSNNFKLRYSLITPLSGIDNEVTGYFLPEGITLNELNGTLTWPAANLGQNQGEYGFAVEIKQFEKIEGDNFIERGSMIVDFQVILAETEGSISVQKDPVLDENDALLVSAGEFQTISFTANADGEELDFEVNSELIALGSDIFNFEVVRDEADYRIDLSFNVDESIVRDNPYPIAFSVSNESFSIEKHVNILLYTRSLDDILIEVQVVTSSERATSINDLKVYPNPVNDHIFFSSKNEVNVQLVNSQGQVLSEFNSLKAELEVSYLEPGVYFLRLNNNGLVKFLKD